MLMLALSLYAHVVVPLLNATRTHTVIVLRLPPSTAMGAYGHLYSTCRNLGMQLRIAAMAVASNHPGKRFSSACEMQLAGTSRGKGDEDDEAAGRAGFFA